MTRAKVAVISTGIVLVAGGVWTLNRITLTALNEPRPSEIYLATRAKHFLITRASRSGVPRPAPISVENAAEGEKYYGAECSMCHGLDGHTPTDTGRWMYPRAADLTSPEVRKYSDPELFWVIKNGIRLSGMPAFGKVETDEHIWQLVQYLRTLKPSTK